MKLFRLPTTGRIIINSVSLTLVCLALSPHVQAGRGGPDNTATGVQALHNNTTGNNNTATGYQSLLSNTTGSGNTATGSLALANNTTGLSNTATGFQSLFLNTTGNNNVAAGNFALLSNETGIRNVAVGDGALLESDGTANVAIGSSALVNNSTGNGNTAVGDNAGAAVTTGDHNIDIGFNVTGVPNEDNTIRIGSVQSATFIAGISGATVPPGVPVIVGTDGHLGTIVSSRQFKDAIKPMDKSSEAILKLKPVTFRYKANLDPEGIVQFGLVAEDVEKVSPDLVARDRNGKPFTVRYEAVNAMLLNEFLKAHRKLEDQQKHIDALEAQLNEQKTLIQKVSAQIEVHGPAPQTVLSN